MRKLPPFSIHRPLSGFARARLAAPLLVLLLTACSVLPDKPAVRPVVYDFGPDLPLASAGAPSAVSTPLPALALTSIEAPDALDGTVMLYRLNYDDARRLRPYAQARWSMPPAQLVQQRLRDVLGRQRVVLIPDDAPAAAKLRVELTEFSQVFETADRAVGVVRLRVTLVDPAAGREQLSAQQTFTVQRPAPSADAAGGVRALADATDAAVHDMARWLQQLRAPPVR